MNGLLPEDIKLRTDKMGFTPHIEESYMKILKPIIMDQISSNDFIESEIWDGPAIKSFIEKKYEDNNYRMIEMSWNFICASLIMKIFNRRKIELSC